MDSRRGAVNRAQGLSYWDLRTVRLILILAHGSFAALCLVIRPFLFEIIQGYSGMLVVMPTPAWGGCAAVIAIGLALSAARPGLQIIAQLASGMLLTMIAIAVSIRVGPNLASVAYALFGAMSLWAFYRVFSIWLYGLGWFRRIQDRLHGVDCG